jgi:hypothetical protein
VVERNTVGTGDTTSDIGSIDIEITTAIAVKTAAAARHLLSQASNRVITDSNTPNV